MAESLGAAASIVGIVSLAGQICSGVQQLYAFVDSVKQAPSDFQNIKNDMLLIERLVGRMAEDCTGLPEYLDNDILKSSLELCLSRITRLLTIIQSLDPSSQKNRPINFIKATVKKARVADCGHRNLFLLVLLTRPAQDITPSSSVTRAATRRK
ncbi:hypothetical protein AFUB_100950 [Aspergillus fumigatus A1163]|uniref:NACHT-NTPase and P-loop NTPases N-terminal domain-containing protein n=1 Tax=Aspergillus fumigatus (strain CBS 144.89 / FGSC A1163 / CEA10) TaxID=451804 RepID=B0YEY7_ASPFC|nr:hypothetical protein AFUB_100950 [Aspergillus fumigatus A1163]